MTFGITLGIRGFGIGCVLLWKQKITFHENLSYNGSAFKLTLFAGSGLEGDTSASQRPPKGTPKDSQKPPKSLPKASQKAPQNRLFYIFTMEICRKMDPHLD